MNMKLDKLLKIVKVDMEEQKEKEKIRIQMLNMKIYLKEIMMENIMIYLLLL
ncbi:Hypothetical Protein MfeM64YM_0198 [Mycoplasmopsis fermentans M64]|uniref:Uncharacterized protein n=1 Tax=Mycoplasmopsis fermentans (strain M64) TaxID=943945 RepID=A0AB32XB29_MYCFM|nr:Hypothetical Protein MfeM64YM_0198 [Mycoplasmopsis fermentans M64]